MNVTADFPELFHQRQCRLLIQIRRRRDPVDCIVPDHRIHLFRTLCAPLKRARGERGLMIMIIQQVRERENGPGERAWGSGSGCPTSGKVAADCPPRCPLAGFASPRASPLSYYRRVALAIPAATCSHYYLCAHLRDQSRATIRRSIAPLAEAKRRVKTRGYLLNAGSARRRTFRRVIGNHGNRGDFTGTHPGVGHVPPGDPARRSM